MRITFAIQKWVLLFGDILFVFLATLITPWVRLGYLTNMIRDHTGAITFSLLLYPVFLYIFDLYNTNRNFHSGDSFLRLTVATGIAGFFSTSLFYSFPYWGYGRGLLLTQIGVVWIIISGWRWLFSYVFPVVTEKKDSLIIGAGWCGKTIYQLLKGKSSPYRIIGFLDDDPGLIGKRAGSPVVLGSTDDLLRIAEQKNVKTAILAVTHERSDRLIHHILEARLKGLTILDMPTLFERLTGRVPVEHIKDEWLLFTDGFYLFSKEYLQKIKRIIDLGSSILLICLSLPFSLIIALAIRLDSDGPVFFRQERMGIGEEIFTLFKFRTMQQDAEINGAVWASKDDSRVTRVGKWLRLLRLDEIPQLYNVLRGDMGLVGPRPERPEFVRELEKKIPYYYIRHSVRPGITGWAQVNYPYGASVKDSLRKLEYDIYYIKNMSIFLELKIILKTIGVVIFGQGAR